MSQLPPYDSQGYRTYYLNDSRTRWIRVDKFGNKDKVTLKTKSGKLVTRTCQYYVRQLGAAHIAGDTPSLVDKIKITYCGNTMFVTASTVLED
jgi:CYTH domain-containing protein